MDPFSFSISFILPAETTEAVVGSEICRLLDNRRRLDNNSDLSYWQKPKNISRPQPMI